jgi:hypothetical protein
MKYIKIFLITAASAFLGSCEEYLDIVPDNIETIESAFTMRSRAEEYLFTAYSYLPYEGNLHANPAISSGDEFWFPERGRIAGWEVAKNNQNVVNPYLNYWDGAQGAKPLFEGIRTCNIFLENIGKVPDLDEIERKRWVAEVKFLKAYYHFYLLRMYGPIPLIKKNLPISAGVDEVQVYRRPVEEGISYIVQLLDEATPDLPETYANPSSEFGRINKAIALAVKAKVLITAASPLFNGNAEYSGLTSNDGTVLFNPAYDHKKWELAAVATKEAIDMAHQVGHKLYYYNQSGAQYDVQGITETKLNIRNSVTDRNSREVIWPSTNSLARSIQAAAMPRGLDPASKDNGSVSGALAPTRKIAEMFYTKNGVPITEDKTWNYTNRFELRTPELEDKYLLKPFYTTVALNFDREPRFYADLGFDGGAWYGQGRFDDENPWYVENRPPGSTAMINIDAYSVTGYFAKKLVNINSVVTVNSNTITQAGSSTVYAWPIIRLADLYLMYAEALNEYNDGPNAEAFQYINDVRARAGLPSVQEAWTNFSTNPSKYTTKEGFRDIVHHERLIELALEGHRYWDLRRWKEAAQVITGPVKGWNVFQTEPELYYQERILFDQRFTAKDYLWPIRELSVVINKNLVQNPGW